MTVIGKTPVGAVDKYQRELQGAEIFESYKKDRYDLHWVVKIYHRYGFLKRQYFLDSSNSAIQKVTFKVNQQGPANGKLVFDWVDCFLQKNDDVRIYALDKLVYRGVISGISGMEVELSPQRERLENLLWNYEYPKGTSALEILQIMFDSRFTDTKIEFNPAYIDEIFFQKLQSYDLELSESVKYETMADVIDQVAANIDSDAVWGVNVNNALTITYPNNTIKRTFFYAQENASYEKITVSESWDKVKFTRAVVTRQGRTYTDEEKEDNPLLADEEDTVYCGRVGYEDTPDFPVVRDLEDFVGKIESTVHLSTMLLTGTIRDRDQTALHYAYQMIVSQTLEKSIKITDVAFDPDLSPNDRVRIEGQDREKSFKVLSDCSALEGWTGNILPIAQNSVYGTTHLICSGDVSFSFEIETKLDGLEYIIFFVKLSLLDFFTVAFLDGRGEKVLERRYQFRDLGWQQVQIPVEEAFQSIRFSFPAAYELDLLQAYCFDKKIYKMNVTEISTQIKRGVAFSEIECGNTDVFVNDRLQQLEWKFKQIDAINNI